MCIKLLFNLVICIHKRAKQIVFGVSIKFCNESGLAILSSAPLQILHTFLVDLCNILNHFRIVRHFCTPRKSVCTQNRMCNVYILKISNIS